MSPVIIDQETPQLSHAFLPKSSLWPLLFQIDVELRDRLQAVGCPHCGGRLDRADYPRKPRGGPDGCSAEICLRLSLCCSRYGCRRRAQPGSVRFLARRVYLGIVVALVAAARQGPSPTRMKRITSTLGVDRRTVERWVTWWRTTFTKAGLWRELSGRSEPAHGPRTTAPP